MPLGRIATDSPSARVRSNTAPVQDQQPLLLRCDERVHVPQIRQLVSADELGHTVQDAAGGQDECPGAGLQPGAGGERQDDQLAGDVMGDGQAARSPRDDHQAQAVGMPGRLGPGERLDLNFGVVPQQGVRLQVDSIAGGQAEVSHGHCRPGDLAG